MFNKFIEDEGLDKYKDFGYVDNMQSIFLRRKEGSNWKEWIVGTEEYFPN